MNLEHAAEEILYNTIIWMIGNSPDSHEIGIDKAKKAFDRIWECFPSVFISNAKLLTTTPQFKNWGDLSFLKKRYLSFRIDENGELTHVAINMPYDHHKGGSIQEFNRYLRETLTVYHHTGKIKGVQLKANPYEQKDSGYKEVVVIEKKEEPSISIDFSLINKYKF